MTIAEAMAIGPSLAMMFVDLLGDVRKAELVMLALAKFLGVLGTTDAADSEAVVALMPAYVRALRNDPQLAELVIWTQQDDRMRPLTDRECAAFIGGLVGALVRVADPETVRNAVRWWADNDDAYAALAMQQRAAEPGFSRAVERTREMEEREFPNN